MLATSRFEIAKEAGLEIGLTLGELYDNHIGFIDETRRKVELFSIKGTPFININSQIGIQTSRLKHLSYELFEAHGLAFPENMAIIHSGDIEETFNQIKEATKFAKKIGYPLIIKPTDASKNQGVKLVECENQLVPEILDSLQDYSILNIQKFISGDEFRVIVLGNEVVFAYQRILRGLLRFSENNPSDYETKEINLPDRQKDFCIKATKALGLNYCGLDLRGDLNSDLYILEGNSYPILDSVEKLRGPDGIREIYRKMFNFILELQNSESIK